MAEWPSGYDPIPTTSISGRRSRNDRRKPAASVNGPCGSASPPMQNTFRIPMSRTRWTMRSTCSSSCTMRAAKWGITVNPFSAYPAQRSRVSSTVLAGEQVTETVAPSGRYWLWSARFLSGMSS